MGMSCFITPVWHLTRTFQTIIKAHKGSSTHSARACAASSQGPGRRSGLGRESRVVEIRRYLLSAFCDNEESPHSLPRNKTESGRAFMIPKALHGGEVSLRLPSMAVPVQNMLSRLVLKFRKGVLYKNPTRMPASQVPPFISWRNILFVLSSERGSQTWMSERVCAGTDPMGLKFGSPGDLSLSSSLWNWVGPRVRGKSSLSAVELSCFLSFG